MNPSTIREFVAAMRAQSVFTAADFMQSYPGKCARECK